MEEFSIINNRFQINKHLTNLLALTWLPQLTRRLSLKERFILTTRKWLQVVRSLQLESLGKTSWQFQLPILPISLVIQGKSSLSLREMSSRLWEEQDSTSIESLKLRIMRCLNKYDILQRCNRNKFWRKRLSMECFSREAFLLCIMCSLEPRSGKILHLGSLNK